MTPPISYWHDSLEPGDTLAPRAALPAVLRAKLGAGFVDAYVKLKTMDWNTHCAHLSEWERSATLDC